MARLKPSAALGCLVGAVLALSACAPQLINPGPMARDAALHSSFFETRDALSLPYRTWPVEQEESKAIIVALHGFNDYSNFFDAPATYLAQLGIASYAYDQRGFGGAGFRGRWFETERYLTDALDFTKAVAERHPGVPLYLLGDSMGGAVTIATLAGRDASWISGAILVAPAVWGRETMPWYQRATLWLSAHTVPAMRLSGRGLKIKPSDNIEMLIALGRDPLIIKGTRVDAIYGLVDLMDKALDASSNLNHRTLILYGGRDEIIQAGPTRAMLSRLPEQPKAPRKIAVYETGYHMLLRDLDAEKIWTDIAHWITAPDQALPSGAEAYAQKFMSDK